MGCSPTINEFIYTHIEGSPKNNYKNFTLFGIQIVKDPTKMYDKYSSALCGQFFGGLQCYTFVGLINYDLKIKSDYSMETIQYVLVTLDLTYI